MSGGDLEWPDSAWSCDIHRVCDSESGERRELSWAAELVTALKGCWASELRMSNLVAV